MNLKKLLKQHEILVYPVSGVLLAAVAFPTATGYPLLQALVVVMGVHHVTFAVNYILPTKQIEPEPIKPEVSAPAGFQTVPVYRDLNEPVTHSYTTATLNLVHKDLRWQQFCNAVVIYQTKMTQTKWTGKGKLFSKNEFSKKMHEWEKQNIVKLANPKNRNDGFVLSGGEGRRYFSDVAAGRKWIALPHSD